MIDLARSRSIQKILHLSSRQQKKALQSAGLFLGSATLATGQGELLLATGLGSGVMLAIYKLSLNNNWQKYWHQSLQLFQGTNGKLAISIAAGLGTTLGVYTMKMLWQETEQKWLVTVIGLEGLGIITILGLMGWQLWRYHQKERQEANWRQEIEVLAGGDNPVKQLLAIRKLKQGLASHRLGEQETRELQKYLQLLLTQSPDPLVSEELLELLSSVRPLPKLQPLPIKLGQKLQTLDQKLDQKLLIPEQESAS
jgi:hypothetical protein